MPILLVLAASFVAMLGCAYQAPPTSPTVLPPNIAVENPPPDVPAPRPVELSLSASRGEIYTGEGLSLRAVPLKGELFAPAVYDWTFGDGTTATTDIGFSGHVYQQRGEYAASVSVRDRDGNTADASTTIVVTNRPREPKPPNDPPPPDPPTDQDLATAVSCTVRPAGSPTTCSITVRYEGAIVPSSRIRSLDLDWGDRITSSDLSLSQSHTYVKAGSYNVVVAVRAQTSDGVKRGTGEATIAVP